MARHVALNPIDHAALRVRTERSAELGDNRMFAPVFPHEFRRVQAHYPIVFTKDDTLGGPRPLALFGLERDQNLFLSGEGWDAAYIPAAIRIAPFLLGRGKDGGLGVHIDLDHPRVSASGEPLFLPGGGTSPVLEDARERLGEVHEGEQVVAAFAAMLTELDLVEPFTLDIELDDGSTGRLAGFLTLAEERLASLDGQALERLQGAGLLLPVYMAVASVAQFTGLIERRNRLSGGRV